MIKICEYCKQEYTPKSHHKKRRFCSTSCRSKAAHPKTGTIFKCKCEICGLMFDYYKSSSMPIRTICFNKDCFNAKNRKKRNPNAGDFEVECFGCGIKFIRKFKSKHYLAFKAGKKKIFCTQRCASNTVHVGTHRNKEWYIAKYTRLYGEEKANEMMQALHEKRSMANSGENNGMYGHIWTQEKRDQVSDGVKQAYADGRLTCNFATSYGKVNDYKGVRLRSMHERNSIMVLEKKGLVLGESLLYEDDRSRVIWFDENNEMHAYIPDLLNVRDGIVYEAKLECDLNDSNVQAKKEASIDWFSRRSWKYAFITQSRIIVFHDNESSIERLCD